MKEIPVTRVRELLNYDPETGVFIWRETRGNKSAGTKAGHADKDGYLVIGIDGVLYFGHRLARAHVNGVWPIDMVDHFNGNGMDNRWENLRDSMNTTNQQNQREARVDNKIGLLGVAYSPKAKKPYRAFIRHSGRQHFLGGFSTPEEAHTAYLTAKRIHHPGCTI